MFTSILCLLSDLHSVLFFPFIVCSFCQILVFNPQLFSILVVTSPLCVRAHLLYKCKDRSNSSSSQSSKRSLPKLHFPRWYQHYSLSFPVREECFCFVFDSLSLSSNLSTQFFQSDLRLSVACKCKSKIFFKYLFWFSMCVIFSVLNRKVFGFNSSYSVVYLNLVFFGLSLHVFPGPISETPFLISLFECIFKFIFSFYMKER